MGIGKCRLTPHRQHPTTATTTAAAAATHPARTIAERTAGAQAQRVWVMASASYEISPESVQPNRA